MPYCQHCGAEVTGHFCANCGAQLGSVARAGGANHVIHRNTDVKPIFGTGSIIVASYFGLPCLVVATIFAYILFKDYYFEFTSTEKLLALLFPLFYVGIAFLAYLPGLKRIRKRAPKGAAKAALRTFLIKSTFCLFFWAITLVGCVYLIGIPFKIWRIGIWASYPNADQYVAFVDGKKIQVTTEYDEFYEGVLYQDPKGVYYRPVTHY